MFGRGKKNNFRRVSFERNVSRSSQTTSFFRSTMAGLAASIFLPFHSKEPEQQKTSTIMLAPQKTLWSTPLSAVDHLQRWIDIQNGDKICDVGCGDGRILFEWAKRLSQEDDDGDNSNDKSPPKTVTFIGIDIDPIRIQSCQIEVERLRQENQIHPNVTIVFVCDNALTSVDLFQGSTAIFLYLIPRGLKLLYPILQQSKPIKVVSYMSKLPEETVTDRAVVLVEHQPGAEWPLYFYDMR